ncbi:hypothetical protein ACFLSJ_03415, partial [Verrucomicrobiota bacterium]
APGYAGGGAVKLTVGLLELDGTILADGVDAYHSTRGPAAGSGGSIWIHANNLTGAGTIRADGGSTSDNAYSDIGGGGGGGRIAIQYASMNFDTNNNVSVAGGASPQDPGDDGNTCYESLRIGSVFIVR